MAEKVLFTWSGGKDSALALYETVASDKFEVLALLTTLTEDYDRVSMHGVKTPLLEQQAKSLGLPLEKILISKDSSNEDYEAKMREALLRYKRQGVSSAVFGDIFLQDVRKRREDKLMEIGLKAVFPLWKRDTATLARKFIDSGFKAIVTCVDSNSLGKHFAGMLFDHEFLSQLPSNVDQGGENGEFHSFVFDGPIFGKPVEFKKGKIVLRDNRFYYCDLLPV